MCHISILTCLLRFYTCRFSLQCPPGENRLFRSSQTEKKGARWCRRVAIDLLRTIYDIKKHEKKGGHVNSEITGLR